MYHIYSTEGIILRREPQGEADLLLYVLTEKFGLIVAYVRSARVMKSKLRSSLQEYELAQVSLIKAKNGWKVTNVKAKENYFFENSKAAQKILSQISNFLLRTITGELPHPKIFETVKTGFDFLKQTNENNLTNLEALMMLRILHELGYVANLPETDQFFKNMEDWNEGLLESVNKSKKNIVQIINKAIKESHL